MWIKYNEVSVGIDPKEILEAAGEKVGVYSYEALGLESGRVFHTGKFSNGTWIEGHHIEFNVKGGSDGSSDEATIRIFNPYDMDYFSKEAIVKLKSGYIDYNDVIFMGIIKSVNFQRSGNDRVVELKCTDKADIWLNGKLGKIFFWGYGTPIRKIIMDVLEWIGIPIGYVYDDGQTYPEGGMTYPANGSIRGLFDWVAKDYGFKYSMRMGRFYWMHKKEGTESGVPSGWVLTRNTGLISIKSSVMEKNKYEYSIRTMMIPGINEESIINLKLSEIGERKTGMWNLYKEQYDRLFAYGVRDNSYFKVQTFSYNSNESFHGIELNCKRVGWFVKETEEDFWLELDEVSDDFFYDAEEEMGLDNWLEDYR